MYDCLEKCIIGNHVSTGRNINEFLLQTVRNFFQIMPQLHKTQ